MYTSACLDHDHIFQVFLKSGNVVQIVSKLCGKSLRILERGVVDCAGDAGTACENYIHYSNMC